VVYFLVVTNRQLHTRCKCDWSSDLCSSYLTFSFSSRRRHTRCYRDWSSDVCSSDLHVFGRGPAGTHPVGMVPLHLDEGERRQLRSEERRVGKEWGSWLASVYCTDNALSRSEEHRVGERERSYRCSCAVHKKTEAA